MARRAHNCEWKERHEELAVEHARLASAHTELVTQHQSLADALSALQHEAKNTLHRRLTAWAAPDLLLINELGYLSFNARGADLLYQVINRHYQRASTLHHRHHNLPFKDWGKLFHNSAAASAIADRLVDKGLLVRITGTRVAQTRNSNQHRPEPALCRSLTRPAARCPRSAAAGLVTFAAEQPSAPRSIRRAP